ncbi:MAG TPA: alpha/beta hydrolase [Gemmatimonadales bacterium]|nr:alpha/beta hydrolase [Gemmatimonadales bacterium]
MTTRMVAGPAGALCVDDGGNGAPAVLFVHSLAGRAAHWSAALEHCRPRRRAVAFDQRGHGRSAPLEGPAELTIETLADDVRAVADACGLRRFALVGHSLGGGVALAFAGAYPDRVERLLLLDPIGDGTQLPAAELQPFLDRLDSSAYLPTIERYWGTIAGPDVAVRERLLADLRATPPATVVAGFRASLRFDPTRALLLYRGPALAVVTPANDAPFSLHRVGRLAHRVLEGTGHWIQLERPAEFAKLLDTFLEAPA